MRKAVIVGYYGQNNAGDDAFLSVSSWGIRKYLKCEDVWATSSLKSIENGYIVKPMLAPSLFYGYNRIRKFIFSRKSNCIVFGGGSNFHSSDVINEWIFIIKYLQNVYSIAVGVSIGPFRDTKAEKSCKKLLHLLSFIGVRDKISYDRVLNLVPDANVKITFDLAPLLQTATGNRIYNENQTSKAIGISLCNYERFVNGDVKREKQRISIVANAIRKCAQSDIIESIFLIDFNSHPIMGDYDVHCELAYLLDNCVPIIHLPYYNNPIYTMKAMLNLRGMISMRLHSSVFAYCTNTPALILSYHEKCSEWAKMIGAPKDSIIETNNICEYDLSEYISTLMTNSYHTELSIDKAQKLSLLNWNLHKW